MLVIYRLIYLIGRYFKVLPIQTYLAGAMTACKDNGADWREKITPLLEVMEVKIQNPVKDEVKKIKPPEGMDYKDYLYKLKISGKRKELNEVIKRIKKADLKAVVQSDFIICFWQNNVPTVGTIEELVVASYFKVPIYVYTKDNISTINEWFLSFPFKKGEVFQHRSELIGFLKGKYRRE